MKKFTELNLGFANAENYRKKQHKEVFSQYFVRDEYLERLLSPDIYFLIGEKGTGKTAYSTYLTNNKYKNVNGFSYDVRQTEYLKFLELKRHGHLPLSQYSEVWRTLFLILAATSILDKSSTPAFLQRFTKLGALKRAIDEFYDNAFSPEILKVMNFVESSELSASLIAKHAGSSANASGTKKSEATDSKATFQTNLLGIRKAFEDALSALKLDEDYTIFIDGIDVRPSNIPYPEYFDCVRGIIEAIWSVNSDYLSNIKDSRGRIRMVLLVRPDIFLRSGLHNTNTKIRDNAVFLDWRTTYKDHRSSKLFAIADRMLSVQNNYIKPLGGSWDHYFPFFAENVKYQENGETFLTNSFLAFLRFSYYRPRDINTMMATMKEILSSRGQSDTVSRENFDDPSFRDAHSNYLLGEIRDQLLFYYSQDDFELFLRFFSHLNGKKRFSYREFIDAFNSFVSECRKTNKKLPIFVDSADSFLQFIYEQNIICYIEMDENEGNHEPFLRWCFRERAPSNLSPKVRPYVDYEIFYGLTKALNVGRRIRTKEAATKTETGTIVKIIIYPDSVESRQLAAMACGIGSDGF